MANAPFAATHEIIIEEVRKIKKNEPKIFPFMLMVDKEAFGKLND